VIGYRKTPQLNSTQLDTNTEERSSRSLYKSPIVEKKTVNSILK